MRDAEELENKTNNQVQLFYKFTNKDFKSDSTSYDNLANKSIPSGILAPEKNDGFMVPYISDQGTAITIKNGRMYFGTDTGNTASPEDYAKEYAETLATALDEKCATNGMSLTDFVRASIVNAGTKD